MVFLWLVNPSQSNQYFFENIGKSLVFKNIGKFLDKYSKHYDKFLLFDEFNAE